MQCLLFLEGLSTGHSWPSIARPICGRLKVEYRQPHLLEAAFDAKDEVISMLKTVEPSLGSTLNLLSDALLHWKDGASSQVMRARRGARGRMCEVLPQQPGQASSLCESYEAVAKQNPLSLLPGLKS